MRRVSVWAGNGIGVEDVAHLQEQRKHAQQLIVSQRAALWLATVAFPGIQAAEMQPQEPDSKVMSCDVM